MPRYVGRARRKKMMKASETIDRLRRRLGVAGGAARARDPQVAGWDSVKARTDNR
jgi:hypothetical protein